MEATGKPSIFISYSHKESRWREEFRDQLQGALFDKARVWCDVDIDGGKNWQDVLTDELDRADIALVLASKEYLKSEWCRQELSCLCDKHREKRLRSVFWLQLKRCAWQNSELKAFQWPQALDGDLALNDVTKAGERDRIIIKVVEEICGAVDEFEASQNPTINYVKALLGEEARRRRLEIDDVISKEGDFALVCRGRDAAKRDVAIKIVPRIRISSSFERLAKAVEWRQRLCDPGFFRIYESFVVNSPFGAHLVLVMEYFEGKRLKEAMAAEAGGRFGTDHTVMLLRHAAEALRELHRSETADGGRDFGFGAMLPEHLFYDYRLKRIRFSALSITNCARDTVGWQLFATTYDANSARCTPPEIAAQGGDVAGIDKHKIDQFALGQLALELLGPREKWKAINPQIDRIVSRMLAAEPQARWSSMEEIVEQLRLVEEEPRALAKAAYMKWIDGDARFFEEFYERFFASMQAKGVDSHAKFKDRDQQYEKLRKGMAAVLNFHPGNEPTSMRYVSDVHRKIGVTEAELEQFAATFIALFKERLDQRMAPGDEMAGRKEEILEAWQGLLSQVLDYFRQ